MTRPTKSKRASASRPATPPTPARKASKRSTPEARTATGTPPRRADSGAPIDGFFAKQPPHLCAILEALRKLVDEAAPDATASLEWGMPFYSLGGGIMCALGDHEAHVNLILAGPPGTFVDPDGLLEGDGKTGRHLEIVSLDDLPRAAVRGWLRTAAQFARRDASRT